MLEGRIPRTGYSVGRQLPRTSWVQRWKAVTKELGQFWNAGYQELGAVLEYMGTVFEGRILRTRYNVGRRDTKDMVQC
jgi:hypothetical protein